DGTWELTVPLPEGGSVTVESGDQKIEIEDIVVTAPLEVTSPEKGSTLVGPDVTFEGKGQPGDTVVVKDSEGNELGETEVKGDGTWELTVPLPEGGSVTVESGDQKVEIEDVVVVAPLEVTSPKGGETIGTNGTEFTGNGQPGDTVVVKDSEGNDLGETEIKSDGTWDLVVTVPEGSAPITVTTGGQTIVLDDVKVEDDTAELLVTSPGSGDTVALSGFTITGTAQPKAEVEVRYAGALRSLEPGDLIGTATANAQGVWTLDAVLDEGRHALSFQAGAKTAALTVLVVDESAELVVTSPSSGSTLVGSGVVFDGTAEPGATVVIKDAEGVEVGRTTADPDTGAFSVEVVLPEGSTSATIEAGTRKVTIDDLTVIDETPAVEALTVTSPSAGGTIDSNGAEFTGKGKPGDTVIITDKDGTEIGSAEVDEFGDWKATVKAPEGSAPITVTAGGELVVLDDLIIVDGTPAPVFEFGITSPAEGDIVGNGDIAFAGTGNPGATIIITDAEGNPLGDTIVGDDGSWNLTVPAQPEGEHTFTVNDGEKDLSISFVVTEDVESTPLLDPLLGGSIAAVMLALAGVFGFRRRFSADDA
ncbi:Ig-like domain-containing protein, partial [Microbacterium sp. NPDC055988]|uniref:Ig-like domain-containing protein n=1 Tax=Microbacterium sp. NPDC055988 TaxID=3345671 RepID=UPI0035DCF3D0